MTFKEDKAELVINPTHTVSRTYTHTHLFMLRRLNDHHSKISTLPQSHAALSLYTEYEDRQGFLLCHMGKTECTPLTSFPPLFRDSMTGQVKEWECLTLPFVQEKEPE